MQNSIVSLLGSHLRKFWTKNTGGASPFAQAYDAAERDNWTNIYSTQHNSLLFRSVLDEDGENPEEQPADTRDDTGAPSSAHRTKIGEALGAKVDIVRKAGSDLALLADPGTAHFVNDALANLDQQFCRVAFVGQMNSGKSSLINVLTQRPDFLPTDINPWTTVVTNLHFGVPDAPRTGAVFRFFNWDEWRRFAEGSPRIKELTKRLMPDFDWTSFATQVSSLRGRAQERLGSRFDQLAGQSHRHEVVTQELLEKYICAGSPYDDGSTPSDAGEYSSITKVADLYFDLECFNFPTVLVDTPGVNDPFLVRDEITRQNLELADIYVVVLTARQPLSRADLNLLRLLKSLNKERIVVFVNKVDELQTIGEHAEEIVSRIRELLAKELRLTSVPIIIGSALWARTALSGDAEDVAARLVASEPLAGSAAAATIEASGRFWLDEANEREVKTETLLTRSGAPALAAALSDLMQGGQIPKIIGGVGGVLVTIAQNAEAVANAHARVVSGFSERLAARPSRPADLALLRGKAKNISQIETEIGARLSRLQSDIEGFSQERSAGWRSRLRALVTAFADISSLELLESFKLAKGAAWRCDTLWLRGDLEAEMSNSLHLLQTELSALQEATAQDLHAILSAAAAGDLTVPMICGPLPFRRLSPSLGALSGMVAVDPDSPVWTEWWSRPIPPDDRAKHLREAIEAEFGAVCEQLVAAAEREVADLTAYILDHFRVVMSAPLNGWHESVERLIQAMEGSGAAAALEADLSDCRERQAKYGGLITALKSGVGDLG